MYIGTTLGRTSRRLAHISVLAALLTAAGTSTAQAQALSTQDFNRAEANATQGFGSYHNSMARASMWWNGKLYVGTSRDHACTQAAITRLYNPFRPYPQPDPTMDGKCSANPADLSLQAEIWRWTPDPVTPSAPGFWEKVYTSPNNIPIPNTAGKTTAREVGFRDMEAFTEADGTQALYASGISARTFLGAVKDPVTGIYVPTLPPPTLLRSTDGINWAPVPQDPGTTMGDLKVVSGITIASFNRVAAFNGKLYLVIGGDFGHGILYEATNPEQGNNAFKRVSPEGMTFTYMEVFKGKLYLAQGAQPVDSNPPYKVVRMDTSSTPYSFPVIVDGSRGLAYLNTSAPRSVATMHATSDALWVATNQPVELIRINPNETWDLFMGDARQVKGVVKYPRTGLGDSFDWYFNIHIHRMQSHNGFLYTSSADLSNGYPLNTVANFNNLFASRYGFDVHRTTNGWYLSPLTLSGFEAEKDPGGQNNWNNFTGRVMNSTPNGLWIGTGNNQNGLQMWRAIGGAPVLPAAQNLEAERTATGTVLSWIPVTGPMIPSPTNFRVFKADYNFGFLMGVPFYAGGTTYPNPFTEIANLPAGTACGATGCAYVDTGSLGLFSQYYVVAENATLVAKANPSNLTRSPSLFPGTTFASLTAAVNEWSLAGEIAPTVKASALAAINAAKAQAVAGNFAGAVATLQTLYNGIAPVPTVFEKWRADDAKVLIAKMQRRLLLAQLGLLPPYSVKY